MVRIHAKMTDEEVCALVDSIGDVDHEYAGTAEYAEGQRLYAEGVGLLKVAEHGRAQDYYGGYGNHGPQYDALITGWHEARRAEARRLGASL